MTKRGNKENKSKLRPKQRELLQESRLTLDTLLISHVSPVLETYLSLTEDFENRLPPGHTHFLSQRPTKIALS